MCGVGWCGVASYMWVEVRGHTHPRRLLVVAWRFGLLLGVDFSAYVQNDRFVRNIMRYKALSFLLLVITPPCAFNAVCRLIPCLVGYASARCIIPTPPRYASNTPSPPISKIFLFLFFFLYASMRLMIRFKPLFFCFERVLCFLW